MNKLNIKKIAIDFLKLVIDGKIDGAYEKYVDMNGKHHNIFFPAGFESLKESMKENHEKFPNKKFKIIHSISENNLVITHSCVSLDENQKIMSETKFPSIMKNSLEEFFMIAVHIFRFQNDKIVEMWDCGQIVPKDLVNKDGAF